MTSYRSYSKKRMFVINNNLLQKENVVFTKPIKMDNFKKQSTRYKIKTMYDSNSTFKKIVFISPMIDLNINWSNLKFQIIKYALDPLTGPNLKLYDLINDIENISFQELKRNFGPGCKFKSIFSNICQDEDNDFIDEDDNNNLNFDTKMITLKISKNVIMYDSCGIKMDKNKLEMKNRNYKFLIELTELWYDSEKKLGGCNFNIVQIKYFPFYYERDLIESNEYIIPTINTIPPPPPLPPAASNHIPTTFTFNTISIVKDKEQSVKPSFSIDKNTLSNALNKLKKVS